MNQKRAIESFSALAHPTRLAVFRLLVRAAPDGVPALSIARTLDARPSTLSGHLAILRKAGLISATRHQREIHYAALLPAINEIVTFLVSDCCDGRVEACHELLPLFRSC